MANIPLISFVLQLVWLFLLYGLYQVVKLFYVEITCPIRDLPGPKNTSLFFGNVKEIASNVRLEIIHDRVSCQPSLHSRSRTFLRIGSQNTGG